MKTKEVLEKIKEKEKEVLVISTFSLEELRSLPNTFAGEFFDSEVLVLKDKEHPEKSLEYLQMVFIGRMSEEVCGKESLKVKVIPGRVHEDSNYTLEDLSCGFHIPNFIIKEIKDDVVRA